MALINWFISGKVRNFIKKHVLLVVILLGILFKLYLWIEFTPHCCGSDELSYHSIAKHLVNDNGFFITRKDDSLLWQDKLYGLKPPLYPFFVAGVYKIFGINPGFVYIVQIIISAITSYFIYLITKKLSSEKVGILAVIIFSFYWETAHMGLTLMSENLHWLLLTILTFLLIKVKTNNVKYFVLIGIICGLMVLNRPASLILLPLISLWIFWRNFKLEVIKNLFFLFLFFAFTMTPWIMRNYKVYGEFVPVYTDSALNVWMGNHPQSGGSYNVPNPNIAGEVPVLKTTGVKAELEHEKYYYNQAFNYILSNPIEAIDTDIRKVFRTFYLPRNITLNETNVRGTWPLVRPKSLAIDDFWELIVSYQIAVLMLTFFAGIFIVKNVNKQVRSLLFILIIGHLIVIALSIYTPRYTTHLYTLMIPFSAIFLPRILKVFNYRV